MNIPLQYIIAAGLSLRPVAGTWYRAVPTHFIPTALRVAHTRTVPGRFNDGSPSAPSFPVLYLSENQMLALFEVQALFGSPAPGGLVPHPRRPVAALNVFVFLSGIADLTNLGDQSIFGTNVQELTGDWRGFKLRGRSTSVRLPTGTAPTQELGAALHAVPGVEGFTTVSAKLPDQMNLVIFPDKLNSGSIIEHIDATGKVYPLVF